MPKRPRLDSDTFLAHIFHPSKNAKPTGLRKTTVVGKGWKPSRRNAFNKMDATKQEILKRSGTRDSYLRGDTTLADARRKLREVAIGKGIARPTKAMGIEKAIRNLLGLADQRPDVAGRSSVRPDHVEFNVRHRMTNREIEQAGNIRTYDELKDLAKDQNQVHIDPETGEAYNPYWYH